MRFFSMVYSSLLKFPEAGYGKPCNARRASRAKPTAPTGYGILLSAFLVSLAIGCASTVKFNIRDKATGQPIDNYSVTVDNHTYSSGETAQLNRAIWKNYSATVEADGYQPEEYQIKKEIIPELLIGGIIFWPAWGWCYGPSGVQEFYLSNGTEQTPMMSEIPVDGRVAPVR